MTGNKYQYVIVGSGLAGVSAIDGIREVDKNGTILLIGSEKNMPYDRPPLSKKLWLGKKKLSEIFLHDDSFYKGNHVDLALGTTVINLDIKEKELVIDNGENISYTKLLLATGGIPRKMDIPDSRLDEICYFRTMNDYKNIRAMAEEGRKAVIIGGGFIGSELAASLNINKVDVTMIFPEDYMVQRIFPEGLGTTMQKHYIKRGITILNQDIPVSFEKKGRSILTKTKNGKEIISDIIIAGIGIMPAMDLAQKSGLNTGNGIMVNEYLQTSNPDIYSAGDNTNFISIALGERLRIEHWDNSMAQGKTAGNNMAGAYTKFDIIPYFFSDLFEFGYEAAGDINPQLNTIDVWKKEYDTGIIYYLKDDIVRGVLLCNVWDKIPAARDLIRKQTKIKPEELKNAIAY